MHTAEPAVTQFSPQRTGFQRLLAEAPYLSRCSDNKTAALVRPREYAVRYPYMQVNRSDMVSWLVFDLDHANPFIWDDVDLPPPNFIVTNRHTQHSHLFYAVTSVCTSEKGRSKPIQYLRAVYKAMATELRADPAYSGPVAKTPGHPWWSTSELHGHEYSLGELADFLDLSVTQDWGQGPNLDAVSHSRHCTLFEELRFYAYSVVYHERENGTFSHFTRLLEAYAHNRNNFQTRGFSSPLSISQVKATVKSVARWTWDRYRGSSACHRGVMALDASIPLHERQSLAAKRTHQKRKTSSESRIREAARILNKQGARLTHTAIAATAKLSRQTVARYKHVMVEITAEAAVVVRLRPPALNLRVVNYGVHQISAIAFMLTPSLEKGAMVDWLGWVCRRFKPDRI